MGHAFLWFVAKASPQQETSILTKQESRTWSAVMALSRFQSRHPQKTSFTSKDEHSLLSVVILWLPSNFMGILKKKKKMTPIFSGSQNSLHEKVEEAATDKTVWFKAQCTTVLKVPYYEKTCSSGFYIYKLVLPEPANSLDEENE